MSILNNSHHQKASTAEPLPQMWKVLFTQLYLLPKWTKKIGFNQMKHKKRDSTNWVMEHRQNQNTSVDPFKSAAHPNRINADELQCFKAQNGTFSNVEISTIVSNENYIICTWRNIIFKKTYLLILKMTMFNKKKREKRKAQKLTTEVPWSAKCVISEGVCCRHGMIHRDKDGFITSTDTSPT